MSYKYRIKATVDAIKFTGKAGQKPILDKFVEGVATIVKSRSGAIHLVLDKNDRCSYELKVGDFIIRKNDCCWPVDKEIFKDSYELIKE